MSHTSWSVYRAVMSGLGQSYRVERAAIPVMSAMPRKRKKARQRSIRFRYPTIAVYANLERSTEGITVASARVLLVGLEPEIVDYSKSSVPGLTAAKVRAAVEADSAKLETLGYSVKSLYVDEGKTAEAVLTDALITSTYDCIMIGAGLRIVPPYFLLFEKLINIVHRHAPASTKICFNSNPADTAEAVKRWV